MIAETQTHSPLRRLAIVAAGIPLIAVAWVWHRTSTRDRGAQLFDGRTPLTGRLVGHDDPLPSEAVQCKNCHALESEPPPKPPKAGGALALTETLGPTLGPSSLTQPAQRRGGPVSEYTSDAFCRLLRDGVDPAEIMIPQLMPRYTLTDAECDSLWSYLTLH